MGWRKTGLFRNPEEILVLTCDVCERDIGTEDEHRPRAHFRVTCHPNRGALDDQEPAVVVCSTECLRAFASRSQGRIARHEVSIHRAANRRSSELWR